MSSVRSLARPTLSPLNNAAWHGRGVAVHKGYSPDNAACEGFFGRLKTEWFCARDWQATTMEQFTQALDACIRWYNEQRTKISLGARSPVEYRRALGIAAYPVQDLRRIPLGSEIGEIQHEDPSASLRAPV